MLALAALALLHGPERMEWTVGELTREARVYAPSKESEAPPLVFAFHGHGGGMASAAKSFAFHEEWPEAVVVYMQGLPTPGITDPDGEKAGWQKKPDDQGGRDLEFFDAVLATLKEKYRIDEKRVYATGHSNGGAFTYLLWAVRPDVFAAIAPSAAGGRIVEGMKPCPMLHVAGENDSLVPFETQMKSVAGVKKFNGCEEEGTEWAKGCTIYASSKGAPVVTFIHGGTHKYPREAPALIVKFFKEQARE